MQTAVLQTEAWPFFSLPQALVTIPTARLAGTVVVRMAQSRVAGGK